MCKYYFFPFQVSSKVSPVSTSESMEDDENEGSQNFSHVESPIESHPVEDATQPVDPLLSDEIVESSQCQDSENFTTTQNQTAPNL